MWDARGSVGVVCVYVLHPSTLLMVWCVLHPFTLLFTQVGTVDPVDDYKKLIKQDRNNFVDGEHIVLCPGGEVITHTHTHSSP